MKNYLSEEFFDLTKSLIRRMKATCLLLLVFTSSLLANKVNSQVLRVSMKMKNASINEVIGSIEKQTDYLFVYDKNKVNLKRKVDVKVTNQTVAEVLTDLFSNTNVVYAMEGHNILLMAKGESGQQQQQLTVAGRVSDVSGGPLPGVTVVVKGTTTGTITDMDGNYSLSNIPENATLQFSFVGMEKQEVLVAGKTKIDVVLRESAIGLEEVVAIGYGTTSKRKMVGAITTMDTKKLEQASFASVNEALQGQVAGLIVNNAGGQPGSVPTISIRGGGTPMYVIDGVTSDEFAFRTLNMEDIESISFLKDASATAVYGSKAGNGIVLVKTKKGTKGKLQLNYSFNYQLSTPSVIPERLGSYEYALNANAGAAYDGVPEPYSEELLQIIKGQTQPFKYPNNNIPEIALKQFAPEQKHNISISGGSDKIDYYVSLANFGQDGLLKSNSIELNRYNVRSNIASHFDKIGVDVGLNINATLENRRFPSHSPWNSIALNEPLYVLYNEDGTYASGVSHPLVLADKRSGFAKDRDRFINTQLVVNWEVPWVKGLNVGVMGNYRDDGLNSKDWVLLTPQYYADGTLYPVAKPRLEVEAGYGWDLQTEANINYKQNFKKHGIDVTFVYTRNKGYLENIFGSRRDYVSSVVDQLFAGPDAGKDNSGKAAESAWVGYVGRLKYDFNSKYIAEFSFRYDGNDNFAPSERWGFFPAVSGAWVISEEPFLETIREKGILDNLKLLASYGQTGISDGVNRHGYLAVYQANPGIYNIGNQLVMGYSEGDLIDPTALTWYTRTSYNTGFNFATLNNQLEGIFDYFYYKTDGYLMSPKTRYSTPLGKALPQVRSNSVQRRAGFDFSLRYKKKMHELYFEVGMNYSRFNQLWEQLDSEDEVTLKNPYIRQTHEKDNFGSVYIADGFYQFEEEILKEPRRLASTVTQQGDIRYVDGNGDGKIDESDKRRVGLPSFPHSIYGIDLFSNYKGWTFRALIQGTGDRYVPIGSRFSKIAGSRKIFEFEQDYWSPENRDATFPRITLEQEVNGGNNALQSDFFLRNARYVRLKTMQIGYDLTHSLLKNQSVLSSCKIVLSGVNLFTFSDVKKYFDPEDKMNYGTNAGVSASGLASGYPVMKTYSIGVNVKF